MDIYTKDAINNKLTKKQDTLVSGTNIKTINGNSLLGSGDVVISGGGGSGGSVSSADYATANTQLNGLTINGTNYKLLDVKVNDGSSLLIGGNRSLASGASGVVAIGACDSSTASGIYSTALGKSSGASGSSSIALGYRSMASGSNSIALGYRSTASGEKSTAIGESSKVYVPDWVGFDGTTDSSVRTVALKSTDNIFFRNENVYSSKTTQASYTSGKTLTEVLNEKLSLVRINISNISDETTGINDNKLVFVGGRNDINSALETMGLNLETLSANWQALMAGENATTIWGGLCGFLSVGKCFGCFYTIGGSKVVSAIIDTNYLGYILLNETTSEGHIVFNSETALKAAFANSVMHLDD